MSSTPVPFIDLSRYEAGFQEGFLAGVKTLVEKTQFVGGPQIEICEKALAAHEGVAHAVGCANGTDALQIALRAAGVGPGDTVLIPDMTFWATFEAVVNVGARPITVDVDRETLHWNARLFEEAVAKFKPKAAFLVHLYGWACPDTTAIRKAAEKSGVFLLEDCAQAFATKLDGQSVIGGARLSTTSFYPAKVLGASGDAGAVFTSDADLAKTARQLVNHGRRDHYSYDYVGWNSRLGAYEALFLNQSLPHLAARLKSRGRAVERYRRELAGLPLKFLSPGAHVAENYYCSVALVEPATRAKLTERLKAEGIGFGTIYPGAMSAQPCSDQWLAGKLSRGNAEWISQAVLNLPTFAHIREDEISRVVEVVKSFFS
jgi:dTDP-4-amino-4,6-dideoxygalactose transaminase